MGVLACDRNGCENIMCNRFCDQLQMYICRECFDELVANINCTHSGVVTEQAIKEFMRSEKPGFKFPISKPDAYELLNKLFQVGR